MIERVSKQVVQVVRWWSSTETDNRPVGFYFWDEAGMDCYGPFDTEEEARLEMNAYGLSLDD